MANDGEVRIATTLDTDNLQKQLDDLKKKLDKTSKEVNKEVKKGTKASQALKTAFNETGGAAAGFSQKMTSLASSGGAAAAGLVAAVGAAKKFIEVLKDCNEAYEVQQKAELALQQAAKNNPYLNNESVERLKDFAGELQKISNYGDEGTIDIMSQLAALGRTEDEIKKIMSAAADYAAATHTDLESAAQTLNATYSGMAGAIGRQIGEVKNLTEEQLKNGEAIDIIAKKYKGFAEEAIDSSQQAKNAFGDFMESVGQIANPTFEALAERSKEFWESMTSGIQKFNESLENSSRTWNIGGIKKAVDKAVSDMSFNYVDKDGNEKTVISLQNESYLRWLEKELLLRKEKRDIDKAILFDVQQELKYRERVAKEEQKENERAEKKRQAQKEIQDAQKKAEEYIKANEKALKDKLKLLEIEAKARGELVSEQDVYNAYLQSYIDLLTKTEGLITEGLPIEEKRRKELEQAGLAVKEAATWQERLSQAIKYTEEVAKASEETNKKMFPLSDLKAAVDEIEAIERQIKAMSEEEVKLAQKGSKEILTQAELLKGLEESKKMLLKNRVEQLSSTNKSEIEKEKEKQEEILALKKTVIESEILAEEEKYEALKKLDEEYMKSKAKNASAILSQIEEYTNRAVAIAQDASNLMLSFVEDQKAAELATLEASYLKGEMSEEEYNEKVLESKKKAAKEEYKIKMFQWTASLLQAGANIAVGVTKALESAPPPISFVNAGLVTVAGGVQLASLIANKPVPPNFAGGGFIGGMHGATMGSDNTYIHARTGEMVANAVQQRNLWEAMNGNFKAGNSGGANVIINNHASNIVSAKPQINKDKIELLIDARVNESMKRGRYSQSLNAAQQGMSGDYYGI